MATKATLGLLLIFFLSRASPQFTEGRDSLLSHQNIIIAGTEACKDDIKTLCKTFVDPNSCLRGKYDTNIYDLSASCALSLRDLEDSDRQLDIPLREYCLPVVRGSCTNCGTPAKALEWISRNIHLMKIKAPNCAKVLFMVERDFPRSNLSRSFCQGDAENLCSVRRGTQPTDLCILAHVGSEKLTTDCSSAIQQVITEYAKAKNQDPEVWTSCMEDMFRFCHSTPEGNETGCIIRNLEFLSPQCRSKVGKHAIDNHDDRADVGMSSSGTNGAIGAISISLFAICLSILFLCHSS